MSFFKREKSPYWWVRTDPVTGRAKSTRCTSKKNAQAWLKHRELVAANPAHAASLEATLGEWCSKCVTKKRRERAPRTAEMYEEKLGHILRLMGDDRTLATVTPGLCDEYLEARRSEDVSPVTVYKEFVCLSQALKLAERAGVYNGNIRALKPSGLSGKSVARTRVLTDGEIATLRANLHPARFACVAFIIATGARNSEAFKARRGDYNEADSTIRIRGTKTAKANRMVPIVSTNRKLFEVALPYLPLKWPSMGHGLPDACERLGMVRATRNDLRRTFATRLLAAGVDFNSAADLMGHTDVKMLREVYNQMSGTELRDRVEGQIAKAKAPPEMAALVSQMIATERESLLRGFASRLHAAGIDIETASDLVGPDGEAQVREIFKK